MELGKNGEQQRGGWSVAESGLHLKEEKEIWRNSTKNSKLIG